MKLHVVRSAWLWWIGDSGRQLFVWLIWLFSSLSLLWYVNKTSVNFPAWEEWLSVPELLGEKNPLPWFLGRLQEHRYVLGRVSHWLIFHATGGDFRAGCYASVTLTSLAVVILLRSVKQLRGRHHYGDILIPLLFLNPGSSENYYLGYQVAFAWNVLLGAWLIAIASRADERTSWSTAWQVAIALSFLSFGGWIGLAFVPPGCVWLLWLSWKCGKKGWLVGIWLMPLIGLFAWSYWELQQNPLPGAPPVNDQSTQIRVLNEYLAMAFGPQAVKQTNALGLLATAIFTCTLLLLLCNMKNRLSSSLGWMVVIGAVLLMGYGLAQRRGNGFAMRNLPLLGLATTVVYFAWGRLAWARFGTRPLHVLPYCVSIFIGILGAVLAYSGWVEGLGNGSFHRERHKQFEKDRDNGLSLQFLACKHFLFPEPNMVERYKSLAQWGHPSLRNVPRTPDMAEGQPWSMEPETRSIPNDPTTNSVRGHPAVWVIHRDIKQPITGVRLTFRSPKASIRLPIEILWKKPDGSVGSAVCLPWLIDFIWTLDFPISDNTDTIWLRTWSETDVIQPVRIVELTSTGP